MIGYDLDGVIDTGKYHPKYDDVIITGNKPSDFGHVMKVMKEFNVACPVYFNPYDTQGHITVASWKSEIINKLGITKYYEDNAIEVGMIKDNCPNCEVIQV